MTEHAQRVLGQEIERLLHDGVGHELTLCKLRLSKLQHEFGGQLYAVQESLDRALDGIHNLLDNEHFQEELRGTPDRSRKDLEVFIRHSRELGAEIYFFDDEFLDDELIDWISVCDVVTEGVVNAIRYAPTATIFVEIRSEDGCVVAEVICSRRESFVLPLGHSHSRGLAALQDRVSARGGEVEIQLLRSVFVLRYTERNSIPLGGGGVGVNGSSVNQPRCHR